jgi:hypothetical protein
MRQGWNDAEQRKLSRAQRSVLKWEGKSAKKDYKTKKREDYWGTGRFKLSKEQKARIAEAEKRDEERGWSLDDVHGEAPKLLKQFEQAHEESKGALAGQFIERETAATKEGKATAKSKMAAAKQAKIRADLDSKISKRYVDKDYEKLADSRVKSEVAAADLARANADYRRNEADDFTDSVTAERAVSQQNADSNKKMSDARHMEAVTKQQEFDHKKNEYDKTKTAAQNNTAQMVAIDKQAAAVRQQMATILERDDSGKLINSPHDIEEKIRLAIANFARPPVGASESVRAYNEKLHQSLSSEWTGMGERLLKEDQYVKRKAYEAQKLAARASVSGRRRDAQLKEATEKFGWMGEEDVLARNYLVDRFTTLGVPLSFLNESGPRAGEIFAYQQSAPYKLDAEGNPLVVKGPDGAETKERHMLLDYDVTIATAEAWAKEWLLNNQPVRAERSISSTTGPASQPSISYNVPTKEQSDAQTTTTRTQDTLQGPPLATIGTPAGRELLPLPQAVKVAEFLDGFRKGQGVLSGSSLPESGPSIPTVTDDVLGEVSTDPESIKVTGGGEIYTGPINPTSSMGTEGLSPDEIKPRFYTDPESIGGMIEDGITSVESLKLGVKEAQAEFNRGHSPGSEAALNRAKEALRKGEEAEDILLTRRIVKDYITEKDYTVVDDKVILHFGRESYTTGRTGTGKPRETKTWVSGIPEKVNQDLWMLIGKRFPMNDKNNTMEAAVGKELFNLTGSAKWRSYGSGGHLGTRVTVPKKIKKLKDAANWKPKGGMSKEEVLKGVRDRESANNELKAMKEKEAKLLKALDDTKKYRTLAKSLGDEISIPIARKLGIIK